MSENPFHFSGHAQRIPRFVLIGLFVLASLYTLYFARAVLIPVALAVILSWILSPAVRGLKRRLRLPPPWGATLVVGGLVAAMGYGVALLAQPAKEWIDKVPGMLRQVEIKLRDIRESVKEVPEITEKAEQITGQDGAGKAAVVAQPSLFSRTLVATPAFLASAMSTLILAYLLLAYGGTLTRRFVRMLPTVAEKRATIKMARSFQRDIARYLVLMTFLSVGLGVVAGLVLHWLGMPNPVLWGVMIAVLNYVPYLGAALPHHPDAGRDPQHRSAGPGAARPGRVPGPQHHRGRAAHDHRRWQVFHPESHRRLRRHPVLGMAMGRRGCADRRAHPRQLPDLLHARSSVASPVRSHR